MVNIKVRWMTIARLVEDQYIDLEAIPHQNLNYQSQPKLEEKKAAGSLLLLRPE